MAVRRLLHRLHLFCSFIRSRFFSRSISSLINIRGKNSSPPQDMKKMDETHDLISRMPQDIIVSILSDLTMKEAATTSVLSHQWEHLWMYTSRLDFDASETLNMIACKDPSNFGPNPKKGEWLKLYYSERVKYVKWVNHVLHLHKRSTLEEFKVGFDMGKDCKTDIDNWLKFAFAKSVKRLELDFHDHAGDPRCDSYLLRAGLCRQLVYVDGLKTLKSLCLKSVHVTGEVLQCFLSNYPYLERLVVDSSYKLVDFEISGLSLMLKHLEIRHCHRVKSLKIKDLNLVSLTFLGNREVIMLENLPFLVEVCFGYALYPRDVISELSSCFSKVEILTLHTDFFLTFDEDTPNDANQFREFPTLTRLKQLVWIVQLFGEESVMAFAPLLKATPNLQRFVLKLLWWCEPVMEVVKTEEPVTCCHANLKVVELLGYAGRASDLEAAMYILKNAVALEQIIVDPHKPASSGWRTPKCPEVIALEEAATRRAKAQFKGVVPPGVKLSIL